MQHPSFDATATASDKARSGEQYAARLAAAAEDALAKCGLVEETISLAGIDIRIRFAGELLRDQMMRAFAHVGTSASGERDCLRVTVWDSVSSGLQLPEEVGQPSDHTQRGFASLQVAGAFQSLFDEWGGLNLLDLKQRTAINWVPDAFNLTERQRAAPLQAILSWWLPLQGRTVIHAAALGTDAGAVLLTGSSHAGKSTTALACLDAGFHYVGDDLCALTLGEEVTAHSLYCSAKVFEHNLARFEDFAAVVTNPENLETEKAIGYIDQWKPDALRRSMTIRAVVVLAGKGLAEPVLRPIPAMEALRAIAPSTFINLPGSGREQLSGLAKVVARVPSYELSLAGDLAANPRILRSLLDNMP